MGCEEHTNDSIRNGPGSCPQRQWSLKKLIWAEKCWFLINGLESLIIILKSVGRVTRLNEYHMQRLQAEIFFHRYSFHFTQTVHSTYSPLYAHSRNVQEVS